MATLTVRVIGTKYSIFISIELLQLFLCGNVDPRLTDYDTLLKNLEDLKEGKQVEVPIYDFKSSSRVGYR